MQDQEVGQLFLRKKLDNFILQTTQIHMRMYAHVPPNARSLKVHRIVEHCGK